MIVILSLFLLLLREVALQARILPNCSDIANCKSCTEDIDCFCEPSKTKVRLPCTLGSGGEHTLNIVDASYRLLCPVQKKGRQVMLEHHYNIFKGCEYCAANPGNRRHCICYASMVEMQKSETCPIKISYIDKKEVNCTSDICNSNAISGKLIDRSNVSDKGGFFVFSGFWLTLNLVQLFIILALLLFIFVKLEIYKHCARGEKNEKKVEERSDEYEKPRGIWDALPLPKVQIDRVESIIYEDTGPLQKKPNSSYLSIQPPDADEAGDYENVAFVRTKI